MTPGNKKNENLLLKKKLRVAGMNILPEEFLKKTTQSAIIVGVTMAVLAFLLISKQHGNILWAVPVGAVFFLMSYFTLLGSVDAKISKRAKEIDKDVLFAGRFLLTKLNSGKPLINSLVEASKSYGVANGYFKEIVKNIELGTPLEKALENAMDDCPSKKMKKILFQINNALKIGIDVSQNLEAVLDDITEEQLVEIQRYGKKLGSLTLFYMLLAVVMPSLGLTMFIVIAGLVSLSVGPQTFFVFAFFILLMELLFISLFKNIRPSVNI